MNVASFAPPARFRAFLPTAMVVTVGLALTTVTTWGAWRAEDRRLQNVLEQRIETHIRALEHGLIQRLHEVEIIRGLFAISEDITEVDFKGFLNNMDMRWQGVAALAWIPWTDAGDNIALKYCEPVETCNRYLAPLAERTVLRQTLRDAVATARTVVSSPITLDGKGTRKATLVAAPVFRRGQEQKPSELRGGVLGMFIVADLVELILTEQTVPSGLDLYFFQETAGQGWELLYYHPTRTHQTPWPPLSETEILSGPHFLHRILITDSSWVLIIRPVPSALAELQTYEPYVVLGGGLLVTIFLATYMVGSLRRTAQVESMVLTRTGELNTANALLKQAKDQAEEAARAKSQFLAAASHDLRQPLQALNLFVNVLSKREHDARTHDIIEHISQSTAALESLLNSLLDISKLDAGLVLPELEDVPLPDLFARLRNQFGPLAEAKGLVLTVKPLDLRLRTDPTLIEDILRNLLSNALRYTEGGEVLLSCRSNGGIAKLEVRDSGPGIPEEQHQAIFREFFRLDRQGDDPDEGVGLGLAIVDRLAQLLGHRVQVFSRPGKGSCFTVDVPLAGESTDLQISRGKDPDTQVCGVRVLVIDDDPQVLLAMKEQLEDWGYTAQPARSLDEAMKALAADNATPNLILADYRLGSGITGSEAIHVIRRSLGVNVPGMLFTGDTALERLREAQASGFRLLHKPVPPDELRCAMIEVVGDRG